MFDGQNLCSKKRGKIPQCQTVREVFAYRCRLRTSFMSGFVCIPVHYCWSWYFIYGFPVFPPGKVVLKPFLITEHRHTGYSVFCAKRSTLKELKLGKIYSCLVPFFLAQGSIDCPSRAPLVAAYSMAFPVHLLMYRHTSRHYTQIFSWSDFSRPLVFSFHPLGPLV